MKSALLILALLACPFAHAAEEEPLTKSQEAMVAETIERISRAIRSHIVLPPETSDSAYAQFHVTVSPNGKVSAIKRVSEGEHSDWETAVQRAILKAQPLPVPKDPSLMSRFTELDLRFRPGESNTSSLPDLVIKPEARPILERAMDLARLETQIAKDWEKYQVPGKRRRFFGARVQEERFVRYVEAFIRKVHTVANRELAGFNEELASPRSALITVSVAVDGTIERIDTHRLTSSATANEALVRAIRLAAPFDPFPDDIRSDTDFISITRTYQFAGLGDDSDSDQASSQPIAATNPTLCKERNHAPVYPQASRKAGEEGTTVLRVLIRSSGEPTTLKVEKSSGHSRLDEAAIRTVSQWCFVPAHKGGKPVDAWLLVPVTFRLEG